MSCNCKSEYNGWTNRETWLINLWDFFEPEDFYYEIENEISIYDLSEQLKELFAEYEEEVFNQANGLQHGLIKDLYGGAAALINFYEIAELMIQNYKAEYR